MGASTPQVAPVAPKPEPAQSNGTAEHARAQSRRERATALAAKQEKAPRFTLDADADWRPVANGAEIAVCNSTPNAQGQTFPYAVYRKNGKETGIPLVAIFALIDAKDV